MTTTSHGVFERLAFGEGAGYGSGEGIAGSGRIYSLDAEAWYFGRAYAACYDRALFAERGNHRFDSGVQEWTAGAGRGGSIHIIGPGQNENLGLVGDDDVDHVEQRW